MLLLAALELPALGLEPLVAFCACAVGLAVGAPGLEPVLGAGRPVAAEVGAVAPPATQHNTPLCYIGNIECNCRPGWYLDGPQVKV